MPQVARFSMRRLIRKPSKSEAVMIFLLLGICAAIALTYPWWILSFYIGSRPLDLTLGDTTIEVHGRWVVSSVKPDIIELLGADRHPSFPWQLNLAGLEIQRSEHVPDGLLRILRADTATLPEQTLAYGHASYARARPVTLGSHHGLELMGEDPKSYLAFICLDDGKLSLLFSGLKVFGREGLDAMIERSLPGLVITSM